MTEHRYSVAMTTTDDAGEAESLAGGLVAGKLAACVQVMPITSHYIWEGKPVRGQEFLLMIKVARAKIDEVRAFVETNHSYDTPEFIELPVVSGLPGYLSWLEASAG